VGEERGHLLGRVEQEQQGPAGLVGERRETFGAGVAEVVGAGGCGGGDDAGRAGERPAGGVGERGVGVREVGAAQPERGGGPVAAGAAVGEGREFGRTAAAGWADEAEHGGRAGRERG
jgi:hypothetical protein